MSLFDRSTKTVNIGGTEYVVDDSNPAHILLAETAREYDMATEQIERAARQLAKAATEIADRASQGPMSMAGIEYQNLTDDITKAQAKREALNDTLGVVLYAIRKDSK